MSISQMSETDEIYIVPPGKKFSHFCNLKYAVISKIKNAILSFDWTNWKVEQKLDYDMNQQTWINCFTCKLGNRNSPDLRIYEKQNLDLIPFPLPSIKACDDFSVDLKIHCY